MGVIRVAEMDIAEIIRQIRAGEKDWKIGQRLGLSKNTVGRYRGLLTEKEIKEGLVPVEEVMRRIVGAGKKETIGPVSSVEPHRETVIKMLEEGMSMAVIWQRLCQQHGYSGSYSSVFRFVRHLEIKQPEVFVRMEVEPGKEAQVDFGYAGRMFDPVEERLRKAWVFVMTLSHSRHQFARFVFDQTVLTWLKLHRQAFDFFGGVVREIVLDNLRAAIVHACIYDPQVQRSYRECAEHYGFLISPCRPHTPEHKGKVEAGGVRYVKNNFLPGRSFRDIDEGNEQLLNWCLETAGRRIHGTTKQVPLEVFWTREKQALLALPRDPYQPAVWKECTLHPDAYVVFEQSFYSAPPYLVGKKLWVRGADMVQIFHEHQLVRTHDRATKKGERKTHPDDVPPEKMAYFMKTPVYCRQLAQRIGPHTYEVVVRMLEERPLNRLRAVQGILRQKEMFGAKRLESACLRALEFNNLSYKCIRRILVNNYDSQPLPETNQTRADKQPTKPPIFARDWTDLFSNIHSYGDQTNGHETPSGTDAAKSETEGNNGHAGNTHSGSN